MDKKTIQKLQANPHYKLSDKQRAYAVQDERLPMIQFGDFERHNATFDQTRVKNVGVKQKVNNEKK